MSDTNKNLTIKKENDISIKARYLLSQLTFLRKEIAFCNDRLNNIMDEADKIRHKKIMMDEDEGKQSLEEVLDKETIYVSLSDIKNRLEEHMEIVGDIKVTRLLFAPIGNGVINILSGTGPEKCILKKEEDQK